MPRFELACFDMDGTLTDVRSSWRWIHDCMGVDNEPAYQAFVNGEIDEPEFMRRDIALWLDRRPGITLDDVARMFRDMPLMDGIQETVACLKANGVACVIVSGGIDLAARMLAREFGFDGYVADSLEAYPDGRLTGEGVMNIDLRDKGREVRRVISEYGTVKERTVSVGNSYTDIPMFEESGFSVAFNPADEWTAAAASVSVESKNMADVLDPILDAMGRRSLPVRGGLRAVVQVEDLVGLPPELPVDADDVPRLGRPAPDEAALRLDGVDEAVEVLEAED